MTLKQVQDKFKQQFTNWLIAIVAALGSYQAKKIVDSIEQIQKDVVEIKILAGVNTEKLNQLKINDEKQDHLLNKDVAVNTRLFKHENIITLKKR